MKYHSVSSSWIKPTTGKEKHISKISQFPFVTMNVLAASCWPFSFDPALLQLNFILLAKTGGWVNNIDLEILIENFRFFYGKGDYEEELIW